MMVNYSQQTKNNDQPLCRFAVIHISFSSFSPKAKVRIRHYARKPEARYAGGFSFYSLALQATLVSSGLRPMLMHIGWGELEKTTDAESGYNEEVG